MPGRGAATHGERVRRVLRIRPFGPEGQAVATAAQPLTIIATTSLALLIATVPVAVAPQPAYAQQCEPKPGQRITDLPWAQQRMGPERLDPLATGAGVTVAVIDSGVADGHPQLEGRVLPGRDFLGGPGQTGRLDCNGHGTAVASLIAARPREGVAFRGLAYGARILPVRVSNERPVDGDEQNLGQTVTLPVFAEAVRWAVDQEADVINLSLTGGHHPDVSDAIRYAVDQDVVVVAAAGNNQTDNQPAPTPYPAAYPGVIGVGAIGPDSARAPFSQIGEYVDVVAPGSGVIVATTDGGYTYEQGTSFAAPFVAAAAALIRQSHPDLTAEQVVRRILATADPAPASAGSPAYGSGVVNPFRAVTETISDEAPLPLAGLPAETVDPQVAAKERRLADNRRDALVMAGVGGSIAVLVLIIAVVLPRGMRRRWRSAEPAT